MIEPVNTSGIDMSQYLPGLAGCGSRPTGKQYGFPKDWDTVALVVNEDMLAKAGVSKQQLDTATWNPKDGGTFEQIVAKLTVDNNGKRGDEPGFDPKHVKTYGLGFDPGGLTYGQTTWAGFAASLGFKLLDKNPWGTQYNYDDPRFAQTFTWWRNMIQKGYMPSLEQARTLGQSAAFQSGQAALAIDGDWTIGTYSATKGIKVGYAPQPAGPRGLAGACTTGSPTRSGSAPSTSPRRASGCASSAAGVPEHRRQRGRGVPGDQERGAQGGGRAQEDRASTSARSRRTSSPATRCSTRSPTRRRRST